MGMTCYLTPADDRKIESLKSNPDMLFDWMFDADETADLDKSWNILLVVLTGEMYGDGSLLGQSLMGGEEFTESAKLIDPSNVTAINKALDAVSVEDFEDRMEKIDYSKYDIYAFDPSFLEEEIEIAAACFSDLKEVYQTAAEQGKSMLIYYSI